MINNMVQSNSRYKLGIITNTPPLDHGRHSFREIKTQIENLYNKLKNNKYNNIGTISKSNIKIIERGKMNI